MPKQQNKSTETSSGEISSSPDYESLQKQQDDWNQKNPPEVIERGMHILIREMIQEEKEEKEKKG